jgi:hypothetical protein
LTEGSIVSLFWPSDHPMRELTAWDAKPAAIVYDCGKCGVRINRDFNSAGEVYCLNGHLNRRPRP